ncbi:MAG: hypothetical protein WD607_01755 [Candidatus Paceibacterota bacterium]
MENIKEIRLCLNCKAPLEGRSDKKFCSLRCKNKYSNANRNKKDLIYKKVDDQLHKNHKVLERFYKLSNGIEFIDQRPLLMEGFNTSYFVGIQKSKTTGDTIYVIYNYGFIINNSHKILIIKDYE